MKIGLLLLYNAFVGIVTNKVLVNLNLLDNTNIGK
jgi:hypothetical protein